MVKEVKMYTVICDCCGADVNEDEEFSCWSDAGSAKDVAMDSDWLTEGDKQYCPDCYSYDDDDNLVIQPLKTATNP